MLSQCCPGTLISFLTIDLLEKGSTPELSTSIVTDINFTFHCNFFSFVRFKYFRKKFSMINLIQASTRCLLYVNISNVTPRTSSCNGFNTGGFRLGQIHDLGEVFSIPKKYGKNSSITFFTFRPS